MKDKLIVDLLWNNFWGIRWYLAEEDDVGSSLGELEYEEPALEKATSGEWEHIAASIEAKKLSDGRENYAYYWSTEKAARKALRTINSKLKERKSNKPLPGWAVDALKNGWKPPKGWTP